MTPFPFFVTVGDSLLVARTLMVRHEVRHLPVKDGDALVGVLTDRDLKRALDPDLGLPPKEELFVRDVFAPDPYTVDTGGRLTSCSRRWFAATWAASSSPATAGWPASSRRPMPAGFCSSSCARWPPRAPAATPPDALRPRRGARRSRSGPASRRGQSPGSGRSPGRCPA